MMLQTCNMTSLPLNKEQKCLPFVCVPEPTYHEYMRTPRGALMTSLYMPAEITLAHSSRASLYTQRNVTQ